MTYQPLSAGVETWRADRRAEPARATLMDVLVFLAGLTCIIIYSPAWSAPLTGYEIDATDSALLRNGMIPAHLAGIFLLVISWEKAARTFAQNWLLVVLMGLAIGSYAWSIDPGTSLRRGIALALITLGGFGLAARFRLTELAEVIATGFAMIAVACLVFGLFIPEWGRMQANFPGAWRGVYLEKNALGAMMSVATISTMASAIYVPKRRLMWLGFTVLAVSLVVLSQSKTALVAVTIAGLLMAMIWMVRRGPVTMVIGLWLAALAVMALAALFLFAPELAFKAIGKDASLTGRTEIWAAAWRQLMERPWLGYGYWVFWDNAGHWFPAANIAKEAKFTAGHAHNGWLETALSIGFVGLGLWALYFVQTWARAVKRMFEGGGAYLVVPFLAVFTLRTLTEVSVLDYQDLLWLIFVAFAVKLGMHEHREATFPQPTGRLGL